MCANSCFPQLQKWVLDTLHYFFIIYQGDDITAELLEANNQIGDSQSKRRRKRQAETPAGTVPNASRQVIYLLINNEYVNPCYLFTNLSFPGVQGYISITDFFLCLTLVKLCLYASVFVFEGIHVVVIHS